VRRLPIHEVSLRQGFLPSGHALPFRNGEILMPLNALMVERANSIFARNSIKKLSAEALTPRGLSPELLWGIAAQLGIAESSQERETLARWPAVLQDVIRAALHGAVVTSLRAENERGILPATLAWVPAYDYTVSASQAHSGRDSAGGITIILGSPYS
jgi:hypothetical protein